MGTFNQAEEFCSNEALKIMRGSLQTKRFRDQTWWEQKETSQRSHSKSIQLFTIAAKAEKRKEEFNSEFLNFFIFTYKF